MKTVIISLFMVVGIAASGCTTAKKVGTEIGHTTRDVTRDIGHATRDVAKSVDKAVDEAVTDLRSR